MYSFIATIQQFDEKGEKSGWTYIEITAAIAQQLKPGNKKAFRVKGLLDDYAFEGTSLLPMGGGDFIFPLHAGIRKQIRKRKGATLCVQLAVDDNPEPVKMIPELLECLEDEPAALAHFSGLRPSHRNYFLQWIGTAKTEATRTKRIALTVHAMIKKMDYGTMIRSQQNAQRG